MRRHEILHLFARRLGLKVGRAQAILSKLQEAGLISSPGDSRRFPDDMAEPEIVTLLIALLAENGIGTGPEAARTFAALTDHDGNRLDYTLSSLLFGPPRHVDHLIVRLSPPGVSAVIDGQHVRYGADPPETGATKARHLTGQTLAAIGAELRGQSPAAADALAAISRIF